jgi:hypothetical protein
LERDGTPSEIHSVRGIILGPAVARRVAPANHGCRRADVTVGLRQQLGLKLLSTEGSVQILVIDQVKSTFVKFAARGFFLEG